jgi:outer membrane protein assembly factor BamB
MRRALLVVVVACAVIALGVLFLVHRPEQNGTEPREISGREQDGPRAGLSSADEVELQRIATLGYIAGSEPVPERKGVVRHDHNATFQGPTLYSGSEESEAILIDMNGDVIHSWSYPGFKSWGRVHVYENGDLLVITEDYPHLMKLNRRSELLWEWNKAAHHDFDIQPDGSIAVLVSEEVSRPHICDGEPFLADSIIVLDPDGTPTRRASILEAFERSRHYSDWLEEHLLPNHTDPLHANSLELFRRDGRRFALLSIRNIDTIAVIDLETIEIVWAITGPWHHQHEAQLVGGRLLLFDNLGLGDQSRVIEFDTNRMEIVWAFTEPGFLSKTEGAQQRLPNGNTLITESDNGRLIEVARDGRIVWEYINPVSTDVDGLEVILGIARAERLPADFPVAWAAGGSHERLPVFEEGS